MNSQEITPNELEILTRDGCCLLDVREPVEHAEEHIEGSQLIPLGELEGRASEIDRGRPLVVMCRSGKRGREAITTLEKLGFAEVKNLGGGILGWKEAGLPVGRGKKKVFPLMQQVQIAIGVGVLAGVFLSKTVHPNFIFLSAFFGAGLLFAGLSGWCGLAILISKMPWNRIPNDASSRAGKSCSVSK
jgi:rhodanese-related sulfurtransferase